jgi:hypothetical protein
LAPAGPDSSSVVTALVLRANGEPELVRVSLAERVGREGRRACSFLGRPWPTGERATAGAPRLELAERIREEAPAGFLCGRLGLDRVAAFDAAHEPVQHPEGRCAAQAEAPGDGCAERAHDPPVRHHPRVRRLAAAPVASRGSAYLHVAAVTRFPFPRTQSTEDRRVYQSEIHQREGCQSPPDCGNLPVPTS